MIPLRISFPVLPDVWRPSTTKTPGCFPTKKRAQKNFIKFLYLLIRLQVLIATPVCCGVNLNSLSSTLYFLNSLQIQRATYLNADKNSKNVSLRYVHEIY